MEGNQSNLSQNYAKYSEVNLNDFRGLIEVVESTVEDGVSTNPPEVVTISPPTLNKNRMMLMESPKDFLKLKYLSIPNKTITTTKSTTPIFLK